MDGKCPPATGKTKTYRVTYEITVEVKIDTSLEPDDEWRSVFYPVYGLDKMAAYLGWNCGLMNLQVIDGLYDEQMKMFSCCVEDQETYEIVEIDEEHASAPEEARRCQQCGEIVDDHLCDNPDCEQEWF